MSEEKRGSHTGAITGFGAYRIASQDALGEADFGPEEQVLLTRLMDEEVQRFIRLSAWEGVVRHSGESEFAAGIRFGILRGRYILTWFLDAVVDDPDRMLGEIEDRLSIRMRDRYGIDPQEVA